VRTRLGRFAAPTHARPLPPSRPACTRRSRLWERLWAAWGAPVAAAAHEGEGARRLLAEESRAATAASLLHALDIHSRRAVSARLASLPQASAAVSRAPPGPMLAACLFVRRAEAPLAARAFPQAPRACSRSDGAQTLGRRPTTSQADRAAAAATLDRERKELLRRGRLALAAQGGGGQLAVAGAGCSAGAPAADAAVDRLLAGFVARRCAPGSAEPRDPAAADPPARVDPAASAGPEAGAGGPGSPEAAEVL
jgi:hypothetical protein